MIVGVGVGLARLGAAVGVAVGVGVEDGDGVDHSISSSSDFSASIMDVDRVDVPTDNVVVPNDVELVADVAVAVGVG
jgi:hypothetical protein